MENSVALKLNLCKHCSSPIPDACQDEFCCKGCKSVYEILTGAGLDEYYRLKESGVCFTAPKPVSEIKSDFAWMNTEKEVKFFLEGIHCSACLWLLEKLPRVIPDFVETCSLNLGTSILTVSLRDASFASKVAQQISEWGYTPHLIRDDERIEERVALENRKSLVTLGIAGALAGNIMLMSIPLYAGVKGPFESLFEWTSFVLAVPSLFFSGRSFFRNVYSGIKSKTFPIDGPILLALIVAFFYSTVSLVMGTHQLYFDSLSALIFLLLSSRYYLARLRQNSQMNLGALDYFISNCSGKVGDLVFLKTGAKIEFDGVVRSGEGWCDHSQFSGESKPIHLRAGDSIFAGTILISCSEEFAAEVLKINQDTRLAKLLMKISEVQAKRTVTELKSDQWARKLLMIVSSIAVVSLAYFISHGRFADGLTRVLALLIVTCPCALALATPLVFTLAMKSLLKKGILVKDPASLDFAPEVKQVYFDKTGTLTEGSLVASFELTQLSLREQSALYSLVRLSRHPASRAIERAFWEKKLHVPVLDWTRFEEVPNLGVKGECGEAYSLVRASGSQSGFSESSFQMNGIELCRISFKDLARVDSAPVVKALKSQGYEVSILSGDLLSPVEKLSEELSIGSYYASQTPEQKANRVSDAMMVGDGVNDALALSKARVSIAVQGGMEAAIQSAQAYSLKPGISAVPVFLSTAHRVRRTLGQNFVLSTSYNLIGAVLSLTGHMNPLWAAVLMPASALTVFWASFYRFGEKRS